MDDEETGSVPSPVKLLPRNRHRSREVVGPASQPDADPPPRKQSFGIRQRNFLIHGCFSASRVLIAFSSQKERVCKDKNRFIMEYIMSKVLIVYGSTTGNTEALAEILGRLIQEAGHETTLLNAADASAPGLCDGWDMILFGCSAWGDDEIILQDDFDALFQQFDLINAKGHKVACFATGDSNFTYFCGAVDVIEAALERLGADVVVEGLKIDGQAQSDQPEIQEWTKAVIETL